MCSTLRVQAQFVIATTAARLREFNDQLFVARQNCVDIDFQLVRGTPRHSQMVALGHDKPTVMARCYHGLVDASLVNQSTSVRHLLSAE